MNKINKSYVDRYSRQIVLKNIGVKGQKKISGYSPKVIADIYIDDKCVNYKNWKNI